MSAFAMRYSLVVNFKNIMSYQRRFLILDI